MPAVFKPDAMNFGYGPFNRPPFGLLTLVPGLSREADAKNLVFDIRKLPPGEYSFPYHYHRNAEEVMLVMSGAMTLRTPEGTQVVSAGEVVFMEKGEKGAHQFHNHTDAPCVYFDVKTLSGMDVVVYPDSGKIMVSRYNEVFRLDGQVDYFDGEENIDDRWRKEQS